MKIKDWACHMVKIRVLFFPNPLSAEGEERVDECNDVGVSPGHVFVKT